MVQAENARNALEQMTGEVQNDDTPEINTQAQRDALRDAEIAELDAYIDTLAQ